MLTTSSGIGCLYVADETGNPAALITDYYTVAFALAYDPYGSATLPATPSSPVVLSPTVRKRRARHATLVATTLVGTMITIAGLAGFFLGGQ